MWYCHARTAFGSTMKGFRCGNSPPSMASNGYLKMSRATALWVAMTLIYELKWTGCEGIATQSFRWHYWATKRTPHARRDGFGTRWGPMYSAIPYYPNVFCAYCIQLWCGCGPAECSNSAFGDQYEVNTHLPPLATRKFSTEASGRTVNTFHGDGSHDSLEELSCNAVASQQLSWN